MWSPVEVTAKLAMPTSMPTTCPVGSRGLGATSSQDSTSIHRRPSRPTWIVLTRPSTRRWALTFTSPTPWRFAGRAERCFALGDDAGVFAKLKGAFEALPDAPKQIFDALPEPKRAAVNAVVAAYVTTFLNFGRHVSKTGAPAGEFPVDHIDARYALDNANLVLSYASKAIAAAITT
jgi:hypothetical protein